jgi:hypothetical protein
MLAMTELLRGTSIIDPAPTSVVPNACFSARVNRPSNVTVDCLYDTDAREHRRPVMFGDEQ